MVAGLPAIQDASSTSPALTSPILASLPVDEDMRLAVVRDADRRAVELLDDDECRRHRLDDTVDASLSARSPAGAGGGTGWIGLFRAEGTEGSAPSEPPEGLFAFPLSDFGPFANAPGATPRQIPAASPAKGCTEDRAARHTVIFSGRDYRRVLALFSDRKCADGTRPTTDVRTFTPRKQVEDDRMTVPR